MNYVKFVYVHTDVMYLVLPSLANGIFYKSLKLHKRTSSSFQILYLYFIDSSRLSMMFQPLMQVNEKCYLV